MKKSLVWGMVLVAVVLGGCVGGKKSTPPGQAEAQQRAEAFYHAYILTEDCNAAWDMSIPNKVWPFEAPKERFLVHCNAGPGGPITDRGPITVESYSRSDDYLFLISDRMTQSLVWVTKTTDGWKIRRYERYEGGEIPW